MDNEPTILTCEDIDKFVEKLMNSEINLRECFGCCQRFFPNYSCTECDECYFYRFSEEDRKKIFQNIIEDILY